MFNSGKIKTKAGGAFFPFLNNTIYNLDEYGTFTISADLVINIIVCV